jgi:hypothetical protein
MSLEALKAFAAPRPTGDVCGLCASALAEPHPHLFDTEKESLECACPACAMLFDQRKTGRWKHVPPRAEKLSANPVGDAAWASMGLPIGLAFFVKSSRAGQTIAWYPGPAGATRCQLSFAPPALTLADDVEALLAHRLDGANEAWVLSIDLCFELVGEIRRSWRGFGGGPGVRDALAAFFARLQKEHARA